MGANVTLFANEVCTEFLPAHLLLDVTPAVEAMLEVLRAFDPLAMSLRVCTDINSTDPKCDVDAGGGQQTTGSGHLLVGDFLNPEGLGAICITSIEDLQGLEIPCDEPVSLAACGDSNGLMEMPASLLTGSCSGSGETLEFGTPDGSGSVTLEISSILSQGSPGFSGTSNLPEVSADLMAIIQTPASTEDNDLDFSGMFLVRVAYIDTLGGNDIIIGSKGPDTIRGSSGVDTLSGHLGNDVLQGGDGDDFLYGDCINPGADGCGDDGGDDLMLGYECFGPNADCSVVLNKGAEADTFFGGPGDDCKDGGRGNDKYYLIDGGSDAIIAWGNTDNDTINGFMSGPYNSASPGEVDIIVNLTGNSLVPSYMPGKKGKDPTDPICEVFTGGNNTFTFPDIHDESECLAITILNPILNPVDFPNQCVGHPYTFQ